MSKKYGVMDQNKFTGIIIPKVELITHSYNPLGTMFTVWNGSRHNENLSPSVIEEILSSDESELSEENKSISDMLAENYGCKSGKDAIKKTLQMIIDMNLPVTESISFTFMIDDASVAVREQLVRHRQAGIWVQTSRTRDARTIDCMMSPTIELFGGDKAVEIYKDATDYIRDTYDKLIELGVPQEDIRLQPSSSTHRIYFFVTLRTLMQIVKKRTSWIAQATLWTPILSQIFDILRELNLIEYLDSITSDNGASISIDTKGKKYIDSYNFELDAKARFLGEDPLPVDPLYLAYTNEAMPKHTNIEHYDFMKSQFIKIWSDDYLEILGWDRNNPSKLGPYDRPLN